MNEQLQSALVQIIEKATTGIDASVSFLSSEMPDVISQLIMWKTSYYSFYVALGLLLVTCSILLVKNVQKGSADRDGSLWWDGSYGISELGFFGCVACVLGFFLGGVIGLGLGGQKGVHPSEFLLNQGGIVNPVGAKCERVRDK